MMMSKVIATKINQKKNSQIINERPTTSTNGLIGMPKTQGGLVAPLKIGEDCIYFSIRSFAIVPNTVTPQAKIASLSFANFEGNVNSFSRRRIGRSYECHCVGCFGFFSKFHMKLFSISKK